MGDIGKPRRILVVPEPASVPSHPPASEPDSTPVTQPAPAEPLKEPVPA